MSSEMREIQHDQHTHPGPRQYVIIGVILFVATILEYVLYLAEDKWHVLAAGPAAVLISIVSAFKFIVVVAYYMHLKFDSKIFTGVFVFPALLGTLVIVGLFTLQQVLPR
jgi:cytochrome c oxidase subunit IV